MSEGHGSTGMLKDFLDKAKSDESADAKPAAQPPAEADPGTAPAKDNNLADQTRQYRILQKDVGKVLGNLADQLEENPVEALNQEELDMLDGFVLQGYGTKVYPLGTKMDMEFQTAPAGLSIESDKEISERLKLEDFTVIGGGRLNNIHLVSIYLSRYGDIYPSFPLERQPESHAVNENVLRSQFESIEGWRNRLNFVTSLDGVLLDYIANRLYQFHQHCDRLLSPTRA